MSASKAEVQEYILQKLQEISSDSGYDSEIGLDSLLFTELGFESLDAVVLGVAIQTHFDRPMAFAALFGELGQSQRDLSIRELIEFTYAQANLPTSAKAILS
jgi:acyl carrier protein